MIVPEFAESSKRKLDVGVETVSGSCVLLDFLLTCERYWLFSIYAGAIKRIEAELKKIKRHPELVFKALDNLPSRQKLIFSGGRLDW